MSRLLLVALALAVLSPLAHAQERESPRTEGARALLFQIGPDLTLRSVGGASLAYKRHTSAERALRVGVSVFAAAEFLLGDGDTDQQTIDLRATLLPLRYRQTDAPIAFYTGIGPTATVRYTRSSRAGQTNSLLGLGGGLEGVVGVEWDVAEALGLTAEYGQSLTVEYIDGPDLLRLSTTPTGARLGLSVYF